MPNLKKKKTRKETARRPGGNSVTRKRENSGAAALEKRRRKPRVSWPPRRALLPGEGPRRTPPSLWGRREGPANPAATRLPARGGGGGGRPPSSPCAKRPHASHQHHAPAHTQGYQTFSGPSSTFHGKPLHSGQGARGKSSDRAAARGRARRAVNASETQRRPAGRVAVIS